MCESAFTWPRTGKLSEQNGRLELGDRLDRLLQTVNRPFNGDTYGLFMVEYILSAWLHLGAVIIPLFPCPHSVTKSKLKVHIGRLRHAERGHLNHCVFSGSLSASCGESRVFTLRLQRGGGKVPSATDLSPN